MPKYWRIGERVPGWTGTCLNCSIVWGVRKMPWTTHPRISRRPIYDTEGRTYPGRVGRNLSGLSVLAGTEELVVLLDVQVVGTRKVGAACQLDGQFGICQDVKDIRDHRLLVDANAEDLPALVDTDDTVRCLVLGRDEYSLATDSVHVEAYTRLEVVKVNEAILGDEVNDAVLLRHLHGDREVIWCFSGEENVDSLLREHRVRSVVVNFNDVKLDKIQKHFEHHPR